MDDEACDGARLERKEAADSLAVTGILTNNSLAKNSWNSPIDRGSEDNANPLGKKTHKNLFI
jgi:hypothetical protein